MIEIYNRRSEPIKKFFNRCKELKDAINRISDNWRPILNDDTLLTDAEVAERLKVSRRTLNNYRDKGYIPYYVIGGKYLYSERDLDKVLMQNYRNVNLL